MVPGVEFVFGNRPFTQFPCVRQPPHIGMQAGKKRQCRGMIAITGQERPYFFLCVGVPSLLIGLMGLSKKIVGMKGGGLCSFH